MAALDQEQIRSLENIRTRLLSVRTSLAKLQDSLLTSDPLPSASSLQVSATLVSNSLQSVVEQLAEHQHLLSSVTVFPLPQFPGRYQGNILTDTLLRTKLEPKDEEWVEQGAGMVSQRQKQYGQHETGSRRGLSESDRDRLWTWAPGAANKEARRQKWGMDYTLAEVKQGVENIHTGLQRRKLRVPDIDEDFDEAGDEDEEFEEVTDDEEDGEGLGNDQEARDDNKMDIDSGGAATINGPNGQPAGSSGAAGGAADAGARSGTAKSRVAGKPAYLETLQEYMTIGRVAKYGPKAVEDRAEAEKKKQRVVPV